MNIFLNSFVVDFSNWCFDYLDLFWALEMLDYLLLSPSPCLH